MHYYVGVDLHKETSWFYILDHEGTKVDSQNIANDMQSLNAYFASIPKPFSLAVESTYNWYFFVDLARTYSENVFLANSYELKAFAKRHKKTDKIDARLIATVLYKGFLPTVFIPSKETRMSRELLKYRLTLITDRSRIIFKLKSLLDRLGYLSTGNYTTYKKLKELRMLTMESTYKNIVDECTYIIEFLNKKITEAEKEITIHCTMDQDALNLTTIPGIGMFSALLIKSEIGDINRFSTSNKLCAYAGLAPRVSQSADKISHGPLNKNRRKHLQWILLEDVYHFIKSSSKTKKRYDALKKRKGHNTAKVIMARELLKIIYHLLKEQRSFFSNKTACKKVA